MFNIANDQGTANQKDNEIFISYLSELLSSKTTRGTNVGKDMEKREPSYTVYGNVNWYNHHGKMWRSLKTVKIELPYDHSWLHIWMWTKTWIQQDTGTSVFIAALFTIVKLWQQTQCPSTDEWVKRCGLHLHTHMHTMDYYSVIKKY